MRRSLSTQPAVLLAGPLAALFVCAGFGEAQAASNVLVGGQQCAAINPRQSLFMEWRENGIFNRDPDRPLFVACPLLRLQEDTSFFGAVGLINDTDLAQDVRCVFREVSPDGLVLAGYPRDVPLAPLGTGAAVVEDASVMADDSFFSVTCRLPPDTGVTLLVQTLQTSGE